MINPIDNFNVKTLGQGDHFGSSDLLKIIDIEFFGNIYAGKRGLKVLQIYRPD